MKGRWSAVLLAAFVLLVVGFAQTGPGRSLLKGAGLYRPGSFTELAFAAPAGLPSQLTSKQTPIKVSFNIHNVSDSPQTYRWSIILVRSRESHLKASGTIWADAQENVTVKKTVAIECVGRRLQVVVRLAAPAESIDFWTTCAPSRRT